MRPVLSALAALILLAGAGAARAAEPFVDKDNGYQLTPPESWRVQPADEDDIKLKLFSANGDVSCNVTIASVPDLAKAPQALLDKSFRRGDANDVLENELARSGLKATDLNQTLIDRDGHPGVYARFAVTIDGNQLRGRKLFMATSGRVYNFNCSVFAAEEGEHAAELDAYFGSVRLIYP